MKLLGFNISKINAERFSAKMTDVQINTKIDIKDIIEANSDSFKIKEEILSVDFVFSINYATDIAAIELGGKVILAVEPKLAKDVIKEWKDKKISEEFKMVIFNLILKKASLKALEIEEDMSLPLHIQFPSLKKSK